MAYCTLQDTFFDHLKFEKLAKILEADRPDLGFEICVLVAQGVVTRFWSWCLRHHPDGSVSTTDKEELESAMKWPLTSIGMVEAMHKCGLMDSDGNGGYEIHNLVVHGGTYAESRKRGERRKRKKDKEAVVQVCPGTSQDVRGSPRMSDVSTLLYSNILSSDNSNIVDTISSNTTLSNTKYTKSDVQSVAHVPPKPLPKLDKDDEVQEVFQHYKTHHPKSSVQRLQVMSDEYRCIVEMLGCGFTVGDCKKAIDGYHKSAFHLGANESNQRYLALTLIFQDTSHVQKGIEMDDSNLESSLLSADEVKKRLKLQKWLSEDQKRLTEGG